MQPYLPLPNLLRVLTARNKEHDIIFWVGDNKSDIGMILGAIYDSAGELTAVLGKTLTKGKYDEEVKEYLSRLGSKFPQWDQQSFEGFTPGQREEAAQIRGWVLHNEEAVAEFEKMINILEEREKAQNAQHPDPFRI